MNGVSSHLVAVNRFLRQHDALTENITVCSNRLNYGADLAPQSVAPDPPITSFTKASAYRAAGSFFKQHAARRSLLVLGDSITDIDAATEVPYDHLISVGFPNSRGPEASRSPRDRREIAERSPRLANSRHART